MVKKSKKPDTVRVILNVPTKLDNTFRDLATNRGLCKSQMILYCMGWYAEYYKTMEVLPDLLEAIKENK